MKAEMTPADLTLIRALIRDVRAHFDGRGISGPLALRLADACEMLMREREREPLTDAEMDAAIADARDALLDHVYEHGTVAEGTVRLARNIGRAVEHAHRIGSESK